ncbi:recombinase family protein [Brevibacillus sp. SYP-B805]|uniref:recombinase family protein n=1 Tax=Brevibacillus sp. SYP-B805 TaxID=1578199 RepID=UPI0013EA0214|nr:recombinase family protein [Brevibacillus sp. SYP-B805]NGQ95060.1 recombinase family protein [Brevibacillus sp. SYP-B805]
MTRPTNLDVFVYLRKSRKDVEEERKALENNTPFDTLAKHRRELLELIRREGHNVIGIFEEVVSGEYLSERPEAQEMLRQIEEGMVEGVVVMDLDRLGRGDMIDAGTIFRAFKFSETLIITPTEVIDCNAEGAELLFGVKSIIAREELKQINKRLQGGRRRSAKDGKSITRKPPYGYLRDQNLKLVPHPEEAPIVRKIFELVAGGHGRQAVVKHLDSLGVKPPEGDLWEQSTVSHIIKNEVYLGHIIWGKEKHFKRNGKRVRKKVPPELWIRHENAHEAIVSQELFDEANTALRGRWRAPTRDGVGLSNPLAGIIKCGVCERALYMTRTADRPNPQLRCINPRCQSIQKGVLLPLAEQRVLQALEILARKSSLSEKELSASLQDESDDVVETKQRQIAHFQKELAELNSMRETAFEMLEKKVYSEEVFLQRHKSISDKIKEAESTISRLQSEIEEELHRRKHQKTIVPKVRAVLENYYSLETPEQKNHLLKSIIEKVMFIRKKEWTKKDQFEIEVIPRFPI